MLETPTTTRTAPPRKARALFLSAMTLCTMGLLGGIGVLYTDMYVEDAQPRYALAAALALPSLAIGIVLLLNRRVRSLQRDQTHRIDALDRNGERMAQFIMSLVGELEEKIHKETATQLRGVLGDDHMPSTDTMPGAGPLIRSAIELITTTLLHPGRHGDARRTLPACRDFALQLESAGLDDLAGKLSERIELYEDDVLEHLRGQYLQHLETREWIGALEVGETIEATFTTTPLARDIEQMRPRLLQAIQDDILTRRQRRGAPPPAPAEEDLPGIDLKLSDQVAESA